MKRRNERQPAAKRSLLSINQAKARRGEERSDVATECVYDQMVHQQVTLTACPPGQPQNGLAMELEIWPDFQTSSVSIRPYAKGTPLSDFEMPIGALEIFAQGVMELVTIARERGFL